MPRPRKHYPPTAAGAILADALRAVRHELGINQREWAAHLQASINSVQAWETGQRIPGDARLQDYALTAEALELPPPLTLQGYEVTDATPWEAALGLLAYVARTRVSTP